jgi:hypothetical protein
MSKYFFNGFSYDGLSRLSNSLEKSSKTILWINHHHTISYQTIILSAALFGSIYMGSISIMEINKILLKYKEYEDNQINKNNLYIFIVLNSGIFMSSTILFTSFAMKALSS